jgi:hypothetical protein
MIKEYKINNSMGSEIIWYEENGVTVSFAADPANSDYQAYLKYLEENK